MPTLHVQTFGEPTAPPVLAVHGVYGHGGRWRELAAKHLDGCCVYAPDLRGQGRSPWAPPWTLEQHVADMLATMDEFDLSQVDVVGFSFGAVVSLHLATKAPERVRRLVLLDPALGLDAEAAKNGAATALAASSFTSPAEARATRAAGWPFASPDAVDQEVADHLVRGEDDRWRWRYQPESVAAAYAEMTRPAILPPAGVPTLLVRATKAGVVRQEYLAACRAAGVAVADVESGHQLLLERPTDTGDLVRDFLGL
ncbi:alpha/beta hydrolase [Actinophytocola sp.]|uniref:alpha/beta fold hydrolase n=1 Tax=Actinophytocola sp. TaxID=1872138 RepID=UPI002ED5667C